MNDKNVEMIEVRADGNLNRTSEIIPLKGNISNGKLSENGKKSKIKDSRVININKSIKNKKKYNYPNNYIKTSKYTCINFLPMCLLLQFKRYANCYFLGIMILQCIPLISPLNPVTAVGPFVIVLLISMTRECAEDLSRHKHDLKENTEKVFRFNNETNEYTEEFSKNLEVGDIIKIEEYNVIPADCFLLSTSNINKMAYIETSNLDGEKDLKQKASIPHLYKIFKDCDMLFRGRGKITCTKPDVDLTKFNGKIVLNEGISYSIDLKQFLFKGTILKNTKWALGVVVYSGSHTKIVLNSQKGNPKQSHLETTVNHLIGIIFIFQICLCVILSILNSQWFQDYNLSNTYIRLDISVINTNVTSAVVSFFSYLLLLNTMIPISLIVTLEVVKYSQAYFMNVDVDMFSKVRKRFVECNSCSLNEELGQIKYIFSDKTGTLTANKLEFKSAAIADELFGMTNQELLNTESGKLSNLKREITHITGGVGLSLEFSFPVQEVKDYTIRGKNGKIFDSAINLYSKNKNSMLKLESTRDVINHYLYCLCLNHTINVDKKLKPGREEKKRKLLRPQNTKINPNRLNQTPIGEKLERVQSIQSFNIAENFDDYDITYKGSNPDEIIFVDFARYMGYIYIGGDETFADLKLERDSNGGNSSYENQKFEILKIMEFNSDRGMMSVVVRMQNSPNNKIILYTKGGDIKIKELLDNENQPFLKTVQEKANKLSQMGLRVLWIAMKVIDQSEFNEWNNKYEEGLKKKVEKEDILKYRGIEYKKIETGLTLIGCTAVEDKLQENVPDTIKELQTAGINVWVLTGDNLATAKNIGIMSNLIPKNMEIYEINDDLNKFKSFVCSLYTEKTELINTDEIFSQQAIDKAKLLITNFENSAGTYVPDIIDPTKIIPEIPTDVKKAILYVGLTRMLTKYKHSEIVNKAVIRGILIESKMLTIVLPRDDLTDLKYYGHPLTRLLLDLTLNSQAVICCRVSPQQKQLVVRMIKKNIKGAITLSVGDGANDVSMIKEADVGVGIIGEEGGQAARSSDYACGEFQCLRKLILFHGRINYLRIAEMILYFFFKNFLFTIPQFYYAFFAGFSGQTLYDDWFVSLFNMVFTSMPLLFKALIDQDINDNDGKFIKEHIPYTYYQGRESVIFNLKTFTLNIIEALVESVIIFFFTEFMMIYSIPQNSQGQSSDFWSISLTQFTAIILIVNYRLIVSEMYHTWINFLVLSITSYGSYVAYYFFASQFSYSKSQATQFTLLTFPQFYLIIFLISSLTFLYDISKNFIKINFSIEPATILRKYLYQSKLSDVDIDNLNSNVKKMILDYDEQVRNKYKVERNSIPDIN